ncbi:GNAT family N-acetyltransferase [Pontibacillus marinus]|uniref:Alanine acetyltransferase n=1 Tax=Pontibacillus marinus BH030004 = DSM 16465 TaxID=1385511 RepID=A0A0A5FZH1_9BACI|nr:GNAT family N-acetyltransferase [Pontibacillus marinus]KGX84238.1 alanine acetyltransferase [Pontibacillus marinus BH030004 = DSM 16465]
MDINTETIPTLRTEHYFLRGLEKKDAESLYQILKNETTMKYITPHPIQSLIEMREKIIDYLQGFKDEKEIPWVIVHRESNNVIGIFRLHKLHMWHKKAELGAIIHPDFQNSGVMSQVLERALAYAFNEIGLNRIVGDIFSGNVASRALLKKFGFIKEGVLRQTDFDGKHFHNTEVYSMLKPEYEKRLKN